MKKQLFMFLMLMLLCFPIKSNAVVTNSSYSVKVNFFYESDCKKCEKEKEWLEDYKSTHYINIEFIDINEEKDLYENIKNNLKIKNNNLPLITIGTNYFIGFNEDVNTQITKAITSYEKTDDYCDIVSKTQNNEDIKDCIKSNKGIYNKQNSIFLKAMIVVISIVLIIGIVVIIKRKELLSRLRR